MNNRLDLIPAALYARVSSDRQDVDLSAAAQLRALRDYAEKNGLINVDFLRPNRDDEPCSAILCAPYDPEYNPPHIHAQLVSRVERIEFCSSTSRSRSNTSMALSQVHARNSTIIVDRQR